MKKGYTLSVCSERHKQNGVNEIAQVSKRQRVVSNPSTVQRSTTQPPRPIKYVINNTSMSWSKRTSFNDGCLRTLNTKSAGRKYSKETSNCILISYRYVGVLLQRTKRKRWISCHYTVWSYVDGAVIAATVSTNVTTAGVAKVFSSLNCVNESLPLLVLSLSSLSLLLSLLLVLVLVLSLMLILPML